MSKHECICPSCNRATHEEDGFPYGIDEKTGDHYCFDCGLKLGMVEPMDYLELRGFGIFHRATYQNGIITAFQKWGRGYRKHELKFLEVTA